MKPVSAWAIRRADGTLPGTTYYDEVSAERASSYIHGCNRVIPVLIIPDDEAARAVREAERALEAAIIALLDSGGDYTGSDYWEALVPVEDYNDVCRAYDALLAARRGKEEQK